MISALQLFLSALAATLVCVICRYFSVIKLWFVSDLRDLPGPKNSSWLYGNIRDISNAEFGALYEQWIEEYGDTYKHWFIFSQRELFTIDPKALHHILFHSEVYQKPEMMRKGLGKVFGSGLLVVEGEEHKRQRRIMNPAFGPIQTRELTGIFVNKAIELRTAWSSKIAHAGETARVDVYSWLSRMTLDVIGLAGFNYKFDALNTEAGPNELNEAFATVFANTRKLTFLRILRAVTPLKYIPTKNDRIMKGARNTMQRIGRQLVEEAKADIRVSEKDGAASDLTKRRDLLSLLVRANTANDVKEEQKLNDQDVIAQINTFIVAGHETTSSGVTWALFALSQAPAVQDKLRAELREVVTDTPTMEELNSLPYLDMVVREFLRLYPPVPQTVRVAVRDDVIPLSKSFMDKKGIQRDHIQITNGDRVFIPIAWINKSPAIWGKDAGEFRPERWESTPESAHDIPGIYSHLLTFMGGPHACIGWRFSLIEIKALLFTLVRAFEFELAVPVEQIKKRTEIVMRPSVRGGEDKGSQMPLLVKPVKDIL